MDNHVPRDITIEEIAEAVAGERYQWQAHAVRRALERGLDPGQVLAAVCGGRIIEQYTGDQPLPSCLALGYNEEKPIHAVLAYDSADRMVFVVTVYVPDLTHFEEDHCTRRKHDEQY